MTSSFASPAERRYGAAAVALHWLIAALLIGQIGLGWYMGDLPDHSAAQRTLEGIHISIGLTVLMLTVARLVVGLAFRPPSLPRSMVGWEQRLAGLVHVLFYVLLFALPLSGWMMESIGPRPIPFWGMTWPHMPGVSAVISGANRRPAHEAIEQVHSSILVWITIALIGLHVAGALKHQFDGSPVLWRMVPGLRRG